MKRMQRMHLCSVIRLSFYYLGAKRPREGADMRALRGVLCLLPLPLYKTHRVNYIIASLYIFFKFI